MAQKKEQYDSAADSIFNFIFANNKKNPPFPTPRPTKNISGNEMAYSLGEIASAPFLYANEETLNVINEPLDSVSVAGGQVKLDSGNKVKVGVSLANASDFFSDPDGFIDKSFAKAEGSKKAAKQLNMIRGLGGIMDLGIGAVAARSVGASSIDSLEMGSVLGSEGLSANYRDSKGEELATRASALEAARANNLDYNSANKQAQIFTSVMESSRFDLADVDMTKINERENHATKRILEKKLQKRGITDQGQIDTLLTKYAEKAEKYKNKKGYDWELGNLDASLAKGKSRGPNRLDEWAKSENPADKLRALKFEELEAEISLLSNSEPRKRQLIGQREHIRNWQLANSHKMRWSSRFGETYTGIQTLNELVLKGGAFPGLITGDFYDPRKNKWSPSEQKDLMINGEKHEEIFVAKDGRRSVYGKMTGLYYLTPKSIGKTLFVNGEGFAYLAHLKQEKMRGAIEGSDSIYNYIRNSHYTELRNSMYDGGLGLSAWESQFGMLKDVDIQGNQKDVLEALAGGENYNDLISILQGDRGSITDPELLKILGQMEELQAKINNSFGLKYVLGLKKLRKTLSIRQNLYKKILTGLFGKEFAKKVGKYLAGGKVALRKLARGLAKKAIHALAQALGFATTGGLANILIFLVTEALYFLGEKLLKPLFKLAGAIVWVIGLFFFALLITSIQWVDALNPFNNSTQTSFDTAGNTAPIFCEPCGAPASAANMGDGPIDGAKKDSGPVNPPPEMAGVECPLQPNPLTCSQGPYSSSSHSGTNAVDVKGPPPTYWYAPSDGIITRSLWTYENSRVPGQLCGGIVHFYSPDHDVTYVLVHVVPYKGENERVNQGEPVAKMAFESDGNINYLDFTNYPRTCADGSHFHLETRGTAVHADRYYRDFLNCDLSSCP